MSLIARFDAETEKSCLASLMLAGDALAYIGGVDSDIFFDPRHRQIFDTVKNELMNSKEFSISSLPGELLEYGLGILNTSPAGAKPGYYLKKLEADFQIRQTAKLCANFEAAAEAGEESAIDSLKSSLLKVGIKKDAETYSMEQLSARAIDRWEKRLTDDRKIIHLGIPVVDDQVTMRSGQTCFVIAPPKTGKTWFLLKSALHVATGLKTLFITAEMHPDDLYVRVASNICKRDLMPLEFSKNIKKELAGAWSEHVNLINEKRLFIAKARGMRFTELISACYQAKYSGFDAVYIDYLQRIRHKAETQRLAVVEMTRELSDIAMETSMLFVVASQAGRAARSAEYTQAFHGKESSSIEEDADVILALTTKMEKKDKDGEFEKSFSEIQNMIVDVTQRNGLCGIAEIKFNTRTGEFFDHL